MHLLVIDYVASTLVFTKDTVKPVNTDTEGAIESVRIKRVEFRKTTRASFPQGQGKLSVIKRCPH